jgi:hypothetical protein
VRHRSNGGVKLPNRGQDFATLSCVPDPQWFRSERGETMNIRFRSAAIVLAATSLALAACGSTYYLVKDAESGREYYTTNLMHSGDAITFKDGKTRSTVTLQNSEVTEISKDQYGASTGAP